MKRVLQFRLLMLLGVFLFFFFASCEKEEPLPEEKAILTFEPMRGSAGTQVVIKGARGIESFSLNPSENKVMFNGVEAEVRAATATTLTAVVPEGAESGGISVITNGKTRKSVWEFTVTDIPTLIKFSPALAAVGTEVVISGTGFSSIPSENRVEFNGLKAQVVKASPSELTAIVPEGVTNGKITVTVKEKTATNGHIFVVFSFEAFSPDNGYAGTILTITGTGFRPDTSENVVEVNGMAAIELYASHTKLVVKVPEGATKGKISVKVDGQTLTSSKEFTFNKDHWTLKSAFPGTIHYSGVGFAIGNKGYVGTGNNGNGLESFYVKEFWEYDPVTDVWTQKADFAGAARYRAVGFAIGGRGYVGTGSTSFSSNTKDFWEYNPATNEWTQKADFGGKPSSGSVGFVIGNKGYIGNGYGNAEFWEYDPSADEWTRKADIAGAVRNGAVGFSLGGKGFVATGVSGSGEYLTEFWEYDPATDEWTRKADFAGSRRYEAVGFSIGSKGYLGGGRLTSSYAEDFWEYDPATDEWTQKAFTGTKDSGGMGFVIGEKGYLGFGFRTGSKDNFREYSPE